MSNRSRKRAIIAAQTHSASNPPGIDRRKQVKEIRQAAQAVSRIGSAVVKLAAAMRTATQQMQAMAECGQQKWMH